MTGFKVGFWDRCCDEYSVKNLLVLVFINQRARKILITELISIVTYNEGHRFNFWPVASSQDELIS